LLDLPPGFIFDWKALTPPFGLILGTLCSPLVGAMAAAPCGTGYLRVPQGSDFS